MTLFSLLCSVCGLSHREAADFLGVRLDTVKSWSAGRNRAPDGVLDALADLAAKIDAAADETVDEIARQSKRSKATPAEVELVISPNDAAARKRGWPCVGAHRAVLALIVARGMAEGYKFTIVPRT
jgi:hypothetical protein